jgi:hypothetical protein
MATNMDSGCIFLVSVDIPLHERKISWMAVMSIKKICLPQITQINANKYAITRSLYAKKKPRKPGLDIVEN